MEPPSATEPEPAPSAAAALRERALAALADVLDPEVGLDVVALGLVYDVDVDVGRGLVRVTLTMTSPACPLGEQIVDDAEARLREVDGVEHAEVALVWEPRWTPDRMSAAARELLGWGRR